MLIRGCFPPSICSQIHKCLKLIWEREGVKPNSEIVLKFSCFLIMVASLKANLNSTGNSQLELSLAKRKLHTTLQVRSHAYVTGPDFKLTYSFLRCCGTDPILVRKQFLNINLHVLVWHKPIDDMTDPKFPKNMGLCPNKAKNRIYSCKCQIWDWSYLNWHCTANWNWAWQ